MYGIKARYLAGGFVNASHIVPNAHDVTELMGILGEDQLQPVNVPEQTPAGIKMRTGFQALDGGLLIVLLGMRFDVALMPTDSEGTNLGDFADFCQLAASKLAAIFKYFGLKAHRLAAVQEGFLPDMSGEEMDKIANHLLKLPSLYAAQTPFEWDWRVVSQIEREFGSVKELTNTISIVKRLIIPVPQVTAQAISITRSDRISVDFDINTAPANPTPRFEADHIRGFFENAPLWHEDLQSHIKAFLFGDN